MNVTSTLRPECDPSADPLVSRACAARNLALQRLLELQSPDGSWRVPIGDGALAAATYVMMLRTTGLVAQVGQLELEARLLRATARWVNPDGGFWKYPGSPSSHALTRIGVTALRLVIGDVRPGSRPAAWYQRNPHFDAASELELRWLIARGEQFLRRRRTATPHAFDDDLSVLSHILAAHADGAQTVPLVLRFGHAVVGLCVRVPGASRLKPCFHAILPALWPALNILLITSSSRRSGLDNRLVQLAAALRATQHPRGWWAQGSYVSLVNMINVMALVAAGCSCDDAAVAKAVGWLHRDAIDDRGDQAKLAICWSHVANTGYGLDSCLRAGRDAGRALEFLLGAQASCGGFAWGSESEWDVDADTTAHALRAFPLVARTADDALRSRIFEAFGRGIEFLLSRQHRSGGFAAWALGPFGGRRGSQRPWQQLVFDVPAPDATARILEMLAAAGHDCSRPEVRRALTFLVRTQSRNGGWWSRWWAGYMVGASFVLRAYAALGLRYGQAPAERDLILRRSYMALERAVKFIVGHQNADGGWGETVRADEDIRAAGSGASTPLHTAHLVSTLLRVGYPADGPVIPRAVEYLLRTMSPNGRWHDPQCTFAYVSRCMYYRYEFVAHVFPVDALVDFVSARSETPGGR